MFPLPSDALSLFLSLCLFVFLSLFVCDGLCRRCSSPRNTLQPIEDGAFHSVCAVKPNTPADDVLEIGDILCKVGPVDVTEGMSTMLVSKTVRQASKHHLSEKSPMVFVFLRPYDLTVDEEVRLCCVAAPAPRVVATSSCFWAWACFTPGGRGIRVE